MRRKVGTWVAGRVTVVRADGMGDALLTIPLLDALSTASWVTGVQFVGVPVVRQVIETNVPGVQFVDGTRLARRAAGSYLAAHRAASEILAEAVRPFGPEVVLAPRSDHNDLAVYELVARSRARLTVGYVGPVPGPLSRHEALASAAVARTVFDVALTPDGARHEGALALGVAAPLGIEQHDEPRLELVASEMATARAGSARDHRTHLVVAPVAGAAKRDWPLQRYASVLRALDAERPLRVTVVGGPERSAVASQLQGLSGLALGAMTEPSDLDATLALMRTADLFLGADSGPAHLAGLAGLPGVVVSCHPLTGSDVHSNAPNRFRPLNGRISVLQPDEAARPCGDGCGADAPHCILGVGVERVAAVLTDQLRDAEAAR